MFICWIIPVTMFSHNVSVDKAKQIAKAFFAQQCQTRSVVSDEVYLLWDGNTKATKSLDEAPTSYMFGRANGGFVIISGDDALFPILGYSMEGKVNVEDMPDNLLWWLSEMENGIASLRKYNVVGDEETHRLWENYLRGMPNVPAKSLTANAKILQTAKWNQNAPFNYRCPIINGERCPTGCTITSMAIMMKYYEWPDYGTGTLDSYAYEDDSGSIRTVPGHSLGHVYDWSKMPLDYSTYTVGQATAVSQLMYDLGVMVKATYNPEGTGASLYDGVIGLMEHMSYDTGAVIYDKKMFSYEQWCNMIVESINSGNPVWYSGLSKKSGHAFILDGYDEYGFFHINWGWGGYYDGYFSMPNFSHYRYNHQACFGLKKQIGTSPVEIIGMEKYNESNGLAFLDNEECFQNVPFYVQYGRIYNAGLTDFTGEISIALVNRQNEVKDYLYTQSISNLKPRYGWAVLYSGPCVITGTIDIGDKLKLFYRSNNGDNIWKPVLYHSDVVGELPVTDQYYIDEMTTFEYFPDTGTIVINTKTDAEINIVDSNGNRMTDGFDFSEGVLRIDTAALGKGVYNLSISKKDDTKIVAFSIGGSL